MLRVKVSTYFWTTLRTAKKKVSLHFVHFHFNLLVDVFIYISSMTFVVLTYLLQICDGMPKLLVE